MGFWTKFHKSDNNFTLSVKSKTKLANLKNFIFLNKL